MKHISYDRMQELIQAFSKTNNWTALKMEKIPNFEGPMGSPQIAGFDSVSSETGHCL